MEIIGFCIQTGWNWGIEVFLFLVRTGFPSVVEKSRLFGAEWKTAECTQKVLYEITRRLFIYIYRERDSFFFCKP